MVYLGKKGCVEVRFRRLLVLLGTFLLLVACGNDDSETKTNSSADFAVTNYSGKTLRIVAGSENKELEPILETYAKKNKQNIEMTYLGSLDIMRMLQSDNIPYDAVWPASTIWLNMGDTHRKLKHTEITSTTPIVFGIRKSLAEKLGFVGQDDVSINEIMQAIASGKLKFAMTSATQSNSGASAYLGFLTALAGKQDEGLTPEDLADSQLQEKIQTLLSGVNRSSSSSNWLVDLFLQSDYDAMVNYETLVIQTNNKLIEQGKEPLYLVYPHDGLAISDSPLAYVDNGDKEMEDNFLKFQEYLLSDQAQNLIEQTGKRSAFGTVREANKKIYKVEWGIDLNRVLSPIRLPQAKVIMTALSAYQTQFKKPALTFYVLDYSGSMSGGGYNQMIRALEQVLIPENAQVNLLRGTTKDITYIVPFNRDVVTVQRAKGNDRALVDLYNEAKDIDPGGGTSMYTAIDQVLSIIEQDYKSNLDAYSPAIVVLSDGRANDDNTNMYRHYQNMGLDIPIFSIMFGDATEDELQDLATLSRARVFDGRENLIEAFQSVKGYN